jgi:hypothetical protein
MAPDKRETILREAEAFLDALTSGDEARGSRQITLDL